MKKILAICMCVICFVVFAACGSQADTPSNTSTVQAPAVEKTDNEQVIKAFEGEYSEEKFKEAIEAYKYHCKPIEVDDKCSVVFKFDFDVQECSVSHHTVDANDPDKEFGFYDSIVHRTITDGVVAFYVGEWYDSSSNQSDVQSFLVRASDESGEDIRYYYFRVKYNERPENKKFKPIVVPDDFDYEQWQIKHNGEIYKATSKVGSVEDLMRGIGVVMGTVDEGKVPTLNGFSNFGLVGSGYTYNDEGDILATTPDGAWRFFKIIE